MLYKKLAGDCSRELFEHTVERTLDGVARRIAAVRENPSVSQAQPIPENREPSDNKMKRLQRRPGGSASGRVSDMIFDLDFL